MLAATLVLALIAASITSAVIFSQRAHFSTERRYAANLYAQQLRAVLKNYVVSYLGAGDPAAADLASLDAEMRGFMGCSANCHRLPGDSCSWALTVGCTHDASALLPASFTAAPRNGTMTYEVTAMPDDSRTVDITVGWQSP